MNRIRSHGRLTAEGTGTLIVLAMLVHWGGGSNSGPALWLGVAATFAALVSMVWLVWWLFVCEIDREPPHHALPGREVVSALVAVAGLMFTSGLLWDEVWHRRLGGFGEDFWWAPHLLIYGSMGIMSAISGRALWVAAGDRAGLRAAIRRDKSMGVVAVISGYMILTSPIDELWHRIYGVDITAWSLPHITLLLGLLLVLGAAIPQLRSRIVRESEFVDLGRWQEWVAAMLGGVIVGTALQVGTAEWDSVDLSSPIPTSGPLAIFLARPQWLLPVVIAVTVLFAGGFLLGVSRRIGLPTLAGAFALAMRLVIIGMFDGREAGMTVTSQLFALVGLIVVDLVRLRSDGSWRFIDGLWSCAAFLVILIPALANLVPYPVMDGATAVRAAVIALVVAPAASLLGWDLGSWFRRLESSQSVQLTCTNAG